MRSAIVLGSLLLLLCGCGTRSGAGAISGTSGGGSAPVGLDTVSAVVGTSFDLKIGQSARIGSTGVTVTLAELREDSRCPVGVQCVSAGNAQIAVTTRTTAGSTGQAVLNLTANIQFSSTATFNGITLRFQALTPSPQANRTIARTSYVASFTATSP